MKLSTWLIVFVALATSGYLLYTIESWRGDLWVERQVAFAQTQSTHDALYRQVTDQIMTRATQEAERGCVLLAHTNKGEVCAVDESGSFGGCYESASVGELLREPYCLDYGTGHIDVPEEGVRAIYMTSQAFSVPSFRERLINIARTTEINSIVIDIKEVDGYVAFDAGSKEDFPYVKNLMPNIREVITQLHEENIYVIGRIVLFKDKVWAQNNPSHAVQRRDDPSRIWTDYGGKMFIDPGAKPFWDYIVNLAGVSYEAGFDEIQADYIRFPSDGNMQNTYYPYSQKTIDELGGQKGRVTILNEFMRYFSDTLRAKYPDIKLSADVFGMVATNADDLTIGQKLEPFLVNFDFVSPMVYPSHYPRGFVSLPGHADNHPYEVVYKSERIAQDRKVALEKLLADTRNLEQELESEGASSTRELLIQTIDKNKDSIESTLGYVPANLSTVRVGKLRPWLQDFTCTWCSGYFPYGANEVREQIQATYDAGQNGWLLWNAANRYTTSALKKK